MTGGHVEEGGLFINDIMMNTSKVSINDNMIYPGIINELGGIGQEKGRVLFESTGPRKSKDGIIMCIYLQGKNHNIILCALLLEKRKLLLGVGSIK